MHIFYYYSQNLNNNTIITHPQLNSTKVGFDINIALHHLPLPTLTYQIQPDIPNPPWPTKPSLS